MWKALLKKQLLETLAFFTLNRKNGKRRSSGALVGVGVLTLYVVVVIVGGVYALANEFCAPFVASGLSWVYFAFFGAVALGMALVFGLFMAKSTLYEAKDNELLLSLPVQPRQILLSRVLSLYFLEFSFVALTFAPVVFCYFQHVQIIAVSLLFCLGIIFLLPLLSVALCSLLGWLIAFVTSRIPAKNLVTGILLIAFLIAYFIFYPKLNEYLSYVLTHGEAVGNTMKTALFPLWQMGLAATGKPFAFLAFAGMSIGAFALVYALLSASFLGIVTRNAGEAKRKYKEKHVRGGSVFFALFRKEAKRFFSNPMVLTNVGLGSVFLIALPFLVGFEKDIATLLTLVTGGQRALIVTGVVCLAAGMNMFSSCSISLEGENLWIVRTAPVQTRTVLAAKIGFHLVMTWIPALLSAIALSVIVKLSFAYTVFALVTATVFSVSCAVFGLLVNTAMPNLHWTNEVVVVKQSLSTLLGMFFGIGLTLLPVVGYFTFGKRLPVWGFAALALALFSAVCVCVCVILRKWGEKKFEEL